MASITNTPPRSTVQQTPAEQGAAKTEAKTSDAMAKIAGDKAARDVLVKTQGSPAGAPVGSSTAIIGAVGGTATVLTEDAKATLQALVKTLAAGLPEGQAGEFLQADFPRLERPVPTIVDAKAFASLLVADEASSMRLFGNETPTKPEGKRAPQGLDLGRDLARDVAVSGPVTAGQIAIGGLSKTQQQTLAKVAEQTRDLLSKWRPGPGAAKPGEPWQDIEIPGPELVKLEGLMGTLGGSIDWANADPILLAQIIMMEIARDNEKDLKEILNQADANNKRRATMRKFVTEAKAQSAALTAKLRGLYDERCNLPKDDPRFIDRAVVSFDQFAVAQKLCIVSGDISSPGNDELPGAIADVDVSPNEAVFPPGGAAEFSPEICDLAEKLKLTPDEVSRLQRVWCALPGPERAKFGGDFHVWLLTSASAGGVGLSGAPDAAQSAIAGPYLTAHDPKVTTAQQAAKYGVTGEQIDALYAAFSALPASERTAFFGDDFETWLQSASGPNLDAGKAGQSAAAATFLAKEAPLVSVEAIAQTYGLGMGEALALRDYFMAMSPAQRNLYGNDIHRFIAEGVKLEVGGDHDAQTAKIAAYFAAERTRLDPPAKARGPQASGPMTTKEKTGPPLTPEQQLDKLREKAFNIGHDYLGDGGSPQAELDGAIAELTQAVLLEQHCIAEGTSSFEAGQKREDAEKKLAEIINGITDPAQREKAREYVNTRMQEVAMNLDAAKAEGLTPSDIAAEQEARGEQVSDPLATTDITDKSKAQGSQRESYNEFVDPLYQADHDAWSAQVANWNTERQGQLPREPQRMDQKYQLAFQHHIYEMTGEWPPSIVGLPKDENGDYYYEVSQDDGDQGSTDVLVTSTAGGLEREDDTAKYVDPEALDAAAAQLRAIGTGTKYTSDVPLTDPDSNTQRDIITEYENATGTYASEPHEPGPVMEPSADVRAAADALKQPIDHSTSQTQRQNVREISLAELSTSIERWENEKDSAGDLGESLQLKLQMAMERYTRAFTTCSNILKKISEASSSMIANLK
ncbi:MAG: hypothetical protein IT381_15140 [Deltaproteobacteria bacterium]|nr:hypothetical protein [Deltaproteobacteria bacterium]